jgi:hypothetical protein
MSVLTEKISAKMSGMRFTSNRDSAGVVKSYLRSISTLYDLDQQRSHEYRNLTLDKLRQLLDKWA